MTNYPAGVSDDTINRYFGGDYEEPDEAELEEVYLDNLEAQAAELPAPIFFECHPPLTVRLGKKLAACAACNEGFHGDPIGAVHHCGCPCHEVARKPVQLELVGRRFAIVAGGGRA